MQWAMTHSASVVREAIIDKLLHHSLKQDIQNQCQLVFQYLLQKQLAVSDTLLLLLMMVNCTVGVLTVCNSFLIVTLTKTLIVHHTLFSVHLYQVALLRKNLLQMLLQERNIQLLFAKFEDRTGPSLNLFTLVVII